MKKRSLFLVSAIIAAIFSFVCAGACSPDNPGEEIKKSIKLNRSAIELNAGESFTLTAELKGIKGELTWSSSDKKIATVAGGAVKAVSAGEAIITASAQGTDASCIVKVKEDTERPVLSIPNVYEDGLTLFGNGEFTLLPEVNYKGETVSAEYRFESMDETVAHVDENGKVTAQGLGETEIYVCATYDKFDASVLNKTIKVRVEKTVLFSLETEDKELFAVKELNGVEFNDTLKATPQLFIEDEEITSGFSFSTENPKVATVDENGVITGVGYGETTVTCFYSFDGKTISVGSKITVLCAISDITAEEEIILKTDGTANVSSFYGLFPSGVEIKRISDVTEEESFMTVKENGELDFGGRAMLTGERIYRIYNDAYAYNAEVVVADEIITTADELRSILLAKEERGSCTDYIVLGNDILNAGEYAHTRTDEFQFSGTLDGRGHAISGIELKDYGLIRQLSALGEIKNLAIINAKSTLTDKGTILCGWNYGKISDVFISGTAEGPSGAVIACIGSIENVVVNVEGVGGNYVAGGSFGLICGLGTACVFANNCYGITATSVSGLYANPAWSALGSENLYASEEAFLNVAAEVAPSLGKYFTVKDNNLYFGKNAVIKAAGKIQPASGKHEIFSFAKETEKTADYAANNIENGYYKIVLPAFVGRIAELKIKGVSISDFSFAEETKTLMVAISEITPLAVGEGEMIIKTPDKGYSASIVVADYVITTAEEFKTVLPYAEQNSLNKLFVLGNDITGVGDYTNAAAGATWFNGTLDGRGYTVSDVNITAGSLFYMMSPYSVLKNVAITGVTGTSAVIAQNFYGTIKDVYVQGDLTGAPSGLVFVAADSLTGLGYSRDEIIENVIVNVTATGAWVNDGVFRLIAGASVKCSATVTDCYGISDIATGLYSETAWGAAVGTDKVYESGEKLIAGIGELPDSFCEFWKIENGKLYFGGNAIIG